MTLTFWLRKTIWNFLAPAASPAINSGVSHYLENLEKNQTDFQQKQEVSMMRVHDWIDGEMKNEKSADKRHKELMEKLDRLVEAIKK